MGRRVGQNRTLAPPPAVNVHSHTYTGHHCTLGPATGSSVQKRPRSPGSRRRAATAPVQCPTMIAVMNSASMWNDWSSAALSDGLARMSAFLTIRE
jgi:hypothetical protein